jgi:small multidrug resistance pump
MSLTLNYVVLLAAIFMEVIGTTALSRSDSFTRLTPTLISLACYGASFWLISFPLKTMPTGVVYATWSGVGIVLIAGIAWLRYGQKLDFPALLGLGFIIIGCIIANGFSKTVRN